MNELLNVLLGMALAVAIVLGLAGLTGLIVGLYVWRRVYVEAGRMLDEMRDMLGDPR